MDLTKAITLQDLPPQVAKLREKLLAKGVRVVIAGGSIRDMYHNRECKDFDFVLLSGANWSEELKAELNAKTILQEFGEVRQIVNYNESCNSRFSFCMKVEFDGFAVDVIEMLDIDSKRPANIWEVFDLFDFNLNQFGIDEHGTFCSKFDAEAGEVLPVREDCSEKRIAYLKEKFPQYAWKL